MVGRFVRVRPPLRPRTPSLGSSRSTLWEPEAIVEPVVLSISEKSALVPDPAVPRSGAVVPVLSPMIEFSIVVAGTAATSSGPTPVAAELPATVEPVSSSAPVAPNGPREKSAPPLCPAELSAIVVFVNDSVPEPL